MRTGHCGTGCDAIMIGRAALGNPFLFKRIKYLLETGTNSPEPTIDERVEACLDQLKLSIEYKGDPKGIYEFRKHYAGYLKGFRDASSIRQKLVLLNSTDEIAEVLREFADKLKLLNNVE